MTSYLKRLHLWLLLASLLFLIAGFILYMMAPDGPLCEWVFYILAPVAIGLGMLPVIGLSFLIHLYIDRDTDEEN